MSDKQICGTSREALGGCNGRYKQYFDKYCKKKLAEYVEMGLQLAQVHQAERTRVHLLLVVMHAPVLDLL